MATAQHYSPSVVLIQSIGVGKGERDIQITTSPSLASSTIISTSAVFSSPVPAAKATKSTTRTSGPLIIAWILRKLSLLIFFFKKKVNLKSYVADGSKSKMGCAMSDEQFERDDVDVVRGKVKELFTSKHYLTRL